MRYITLFLIFISTTLLAQEGMWIPSLLEANEAEMQEMGFQLTAEDVYAVNTGSMKDAVLIFGGGCTGEVISDKGLVLTNHHCGFGSINRLSSVENNYLRDGFWASDQQSEIPAPGLKVTFIIRIDDVTDAVNKGLNATADNEEVLTQRMDSLIKKATDGTHYDAVVKSFYYGNKYYMFTTETFTDIRLVGTPPRSVGEFGGETDNWIWPRHTGDFSIWRIYANADNLPADYAPDNQPYQPRYHFPVSLEGINEGDFTMVFGFPGRTQEYLPVQAISNIALESNPDKVALRELRIRTMEKYMRGNDTITLMYASKTKGLANAYKKWQGESLGLKANNAFEKKRAFEHTFEMWARDSKYAGVTQRLNTLHSQLTEYNRAVDYTFEAALAIEATRYAHNYRTLAALLADSTGTEEAIVKEVEKLREGVDAYFANYYLPLDREVFPLLLEKLYINVDSTLQPDWFREQTVRYKNDFQTWANAIYNSSALVSADGTFALLDAIRQGDKSILKSDPVYQLYDAFYANYKAIQAESLEPIQQLIEQEMSLYMEGIMNSNLKERLYPDANSTLRVAYGKVSGYTPRNGVYYKPQTTHVGIMEKHKDGDEEFDVPDALLELLEAGDFGKYALPNGELPVAFLASNHTTGGNSGSPVLNAKGELIGTNFDRVWEGTMSDLNYDFSRCRNISVDIRYTLFIVEYLGKANWIIEEILK